MAVDKTQELYDWDLALGTNPTEIATNPTVADTSLTATKPEPEPDIDEQRDQRRKDLEAGQGFLESPEAGSISDLIGQYGGTPIDINKEKYDTGEKLRILNEEEDLLSRIKSGEITVDEGDLAAYRQAVTKETSPFASHFQVPNVPTTKAGILTAGGRMIPGPPTKKAFSFDLFGAVQTKGGKTGMEMLGISKSQAASVQQQIVERRENIRDIAAANRAYESIPKRFITKKDGKYELDVTGAMGAGISLATLRAAGFDIPEPKPSRPIPGFSGSTGYAMQQLYGNFPMNAAAKPGVNKNVPSYDEWLASKGLKSGMKFLPYEEAELKKSYDWEVLGGGGFDKWATEKPYALLGATVFAGGVVTSPLWLGSVPAVLSIVPRLAQSARWLAPKLVASGLTYEAATGIGSTIFGATQRGNFSTQTQQDLIRLENVPNSDMAKGIASRYISETDAKGNSLIDVEKLFKDYGQAGGMAILAGLGNTPTIDRALWNQLSASAKSKYTPTANPGIEYSSNPLIASYGLGARRSRESLANWTAGKPWYAPSSLASGFYTYMNPSLLVQEQWATRGGVSLLSAIPHFGPTAAYPFVSGASTGAKITGIGFAALPFVAGPVGSLFGRVGRAVSGRFPTASKVVSAPFRAVGWAGETTGITPAMQTFEQFAPWQLANTIGRGLGRLRVPLFWQSQLELGLRSPLRPSGQTGMVSSWFPSAPRLTNTSRIWNPWSRGSAAGLGHTKATWKAERDSISNALYNKKAELYNPAANKYNAWLEERVRAGELIRVDDYTGPFYFTPEEYRAWAAAGFPELRAPSAPDLDVLPRIPKSVEEMGSPGPHPSPLHELRTSQLTGKPYWFKPEPGMEVRELASPYRGPGGQMITKEYYKPGPGYRFGEDYYGRPTIDRPAIVRSYSNITNLGIGEVKTDVPFYRAWGTPGAKIAPIITRAALTGAVVATPALSLASSFNVVGPSLATSIARSTVVADINNVASMASEGVITQDQATTIVNNLVNAYDNQVSQSQYQVVRQQVTASTLTQDQQNQLQQRTQVDTNIQTNLETQRIQQMQERTQFQQQVSVLDMFTAPSILTQMLRQELTRATQESTQEEATEETTGGNTRVVPPLLPGMLGYPGGLGFGGGGWPRGLRRSLVGTWEFGSYDVSGPNPLTGEVVTSKFKPKSQRYGSKRITEPRYIRGRGVVA